MKKLFGTFVLIIIICNSFSTPVFALVCGESIPPGTSEGTLKEYKADCEAKIAASRGVRTTLATTISYLNNQISLAQAKITTTTIQLDNVNAEINDLSGRIGSIDYSLTDLTKIFVSRVRETYMFRSRNDIIILAQSTGLSDVMRNIEYAKQIRDYDRNILVSLEKSRLDASAQKTLKELKQKEIEALKQKLDKDRANLAAQVSSKNQLLAETKNSESQYQKLLADAQAQLAAFNKFVSSQGGAVILTGTTRDDTGWGKYYNQRDAQWGNKPLGASSISVSDAGCLITSMSMIMTHYGKSVSPGDIASNPDYFSSYYPYADFRQGDLTINGVGTTRTRVGYSQSALDNELAAGKPVILGVSPYGSGKPEHFIVVKQKDGGDYLINDPFIENGMNIKFTAHYTLAAIRTVDRVTVN